MTGTFHQRFNRMARRITLLMLAASIALPTATLCAYQDGIEVSVAGLSITRPKPGDEYGMSMVMGRSAGVEIHVRIAAPQHHIIKIGESPNKRPQLSVAGGKALEAGERFSDFGFFSQIDEDGKAVTIPISATELPPAGTKQLKLSGEVVLTTGADPKTVDRKLALKAGEKVALGKIACEIEEVSEDSFGDEGTIVNFKSGESLATLQSLKFFDASGKEIESSSAGSSSFGFGGDMTYNTNYRLAGKPENVVVKIQYFESTKEVTVKLDRTISLGLDE